MTFKNRAPIQIRAIRHTLARNVKDSVFEIEGAANWMMKRRNTNTNILIEASEWQYNRTLK